jgi:hypothetical protein
MESENAPQSAQKTISPMVARLIIAVAVALMIIGTATHLLPDYIIIPSFLVLCIGLIIATGSKPAGMDLRYVVLTLAVSFAYFILLNRYESLSGGYFAFGKSLGFFLGEIPLLSIFLVAIPAILSQNFIRNIQMNIYLRSLAGSVLIGIPIAFVMFAGPLVDVLYWENLLPSPVVFVSVFILSYFLAFAGQQLNYTMSTRLYREIYLSWILFWIAAFGIHQFA